MPKQSRACLPSTTNTPMRNSRLVFITFQSQMCHFIPRPDQLFAPVTPGRQLFPTCRPSQLANRQTCQLLASATPRLAWKWLWSHFSKLKHLWDLPCTSWPVLDIVQTNLPYAKSAHGAIGPVRVLLQNIASLDLGGESCNLCITKIMTPTLMVLDIAVGHRKIRVPIQLCRDSVELYVAEWDLRCA